MTPKTYMRTLVEDGEIPYPGEGETRQREQLGVGGYFTNLRGLCERKRTVWRVGLLTTTFPVPLLSRPSTTQSMEIFKDSEKRSEPYGECVQ